MTLAVPYFSIPSAHPPFCLRHTLTVHATVSSKNHVAMAPEEGAVDLPSSSGAPAAIPLTFNATDNADYNDHSHSSELQGPRDRGDTRGKKRGRGPGRWKGKGKRSHDDNGRLPEGSDWRDIRDAKRRKKDNGDGPDKSDEPSYMNIKFDQAEIDAEERRPKRKVAVLIGYSGTGYHGLQINHQHKTIEGDLFAAFVAAKAIAKRNADDPKKSSFVRCARTDKGVHAGGNMVSLKLTIEDPDIVAKINEHLPPQIRIWGLERTNNQFSSYRACDSRWYEYLMPTYCLLPPHHESFLGRKVLQSIKAHGLEDQYAQRMSSVKDYWAEVDKNDIQPILDGLDPKLREAVESHIHAQELSDQDKPVAKASDSDETPVSAEAAVDGPSTSEEASDVPAVTEEATSKAAEAAPTSTTDEPMLDPQFSNDRKPKELSPFEKAIKEIKAAYVAAKRRYRVTPDRLDELQTSLRQYEGTKNFHNYTVQVSHKDASAKRSIKSFVVNRKPINYEDTEWISIKVHGQSFMMHQIRKMVAMAVLGVRCATPLERFEETFSPARISIPKAPSLGLLLERPVFDAYNKRATETLNLQPLDYSKYEKEIEAFKAEHIYNHIFQLEEKENSFHVFFNQIDCFKNDHFLWLTADGLEAATQRSGPREVEYMALDGDESDEGEVNKGGEGEEG
ncbi:pseudouridine synthase [Xylariaceae sp. FL1019]|nr:pseudouridine synthase [Xylariaceae sp. FL1019]